MIPVLLNRIDPTMARAYDDIPRQGVDRTVPLDTEPTTNVRAHEAAHPPVRSKETRSEHVLLKGASRGAYRLRALQQDAPLEETGFEEIDRVPEAGDLDRLYERIPGEALHAVFEHTGQGAVLYRSGGRLSGDWTNRDMFDRVTIFTDADDAQAFAEERRTSGSEIGSGAKLGD